MCYINLHSCNIVSESVAFVYCCVYPLNAGKELLFEINISPLRNEISQTMVFWEFVDSPPYTLLINPNRSSNSPPVTPSTTYMNVTQRKKPSPLSLPSGMDSGDYFPRRRTVVAPPPGIF